MASVSSIEYMEVQSRTLGGALVFIGDNLTHLYDKVTKRTLTPQPIDLYYLYLLGHGCIMIQQRVVVVPSSE